MDAVVLHSDIARLVLGYLERQKLEGTSRLFCKTSPHLKHELTVYRSGFTPHSFCPDLEDIICEYVNIKHIVDRFVSSLISSQRFELFELKLPEKVKLLLERGLASNLKTQQGENATFNKNITKNNSTPSSINSDKENTANKHPKQKRKRNSVAYSSDERISPLFLSSKDIKRRRILEPFCFISAKQQNLQRQRQTVQTPSTGGDQTQTDDENEDTLDEDSNEPENEEENRRYDNEKYLSLREKPTKESTPRCKSANGKFSTPSELSQAILDNPQFQMKLVDNINQALNNSKCSETQPAVSNVKASTSNMAANETNLSEEQQIITSNEMLDQMVKDILKATEQDPAFDAIVENVVGASIQPTNVSAGVQCKIDTTPAAQQQLISVPAVFEQQQFAFVQQHQQQSTLPTLSTMSQQSTEPSTASRTPMVIRTAITTSNTSLNSGIGDAQILSSLTANNSFGSLIDPNFSLSKLIVLNSNDSAQKQAPSGDQIIGNTTADNLINQLGNIGDATGDEQGFMDSNSGQYLVFVDGIIQQFQLDNTNNLERCRNEITLLEPILAPTDQVPQNAITESNIQKANTSEEKHVVGRLEPCTACKKTQDIAVDNETPSGSGIVNMKAFKSLSTPRKRTSHVRTLTFSPKAMVSDHAAQKSGLRPNLSAEECEELSNSANISERPIIKNVEILPSLGGPIDASANESSNSCSVPHLFVTEESSNQTVIKTELSLGEITVVEKTDKSATATIQNADTPKRKQIRRTAVRACKRQLSKSSDESESKPKSTIETDKSEESDKGSLPQTTEQRLANVKDDKMMEEWLRLRNASSRDLDSRLRQINAEQLAVLPKSVRRAKNALKRRNLRRKKPAISKRMRKKARQEAHKKALLGESEADMSVLEGERNEVVKADIRIVKITKHGKVTTDSKRVRKDRNKEFNIKIPTPQKEKRESLTKTKSECVESASPDIDVANDAVDATAYTDPAEQTADNSPTHVPEDHTEQERDRRTANIACLLDTPFKESTLMDEIPPTPGKPVHSLDTPAIKLRAADGDLQFSPSYLFGSLTKSEIDTPQLNAITPGLRFTPHGSSRDVTPRSATGQTDYSSGGSYYKPDESEDLDRNFEKLLRDSAQKQRQEEEKKKLLEQHLNAVEVKSALFEEPSQAVVDNKEQGVTEEICVEIPTETLRVEPIVLKRVKSFGAEGTENSEATSNIDPHYTLVSELPEICAEGESSNSSSTISTSSSSSSSKSSTSSSSSSPNSSGATDQEKVVTNATDTLKNPGNLSLSLDNLSIISSTEDEEWQKLAVTEEENSQLVSNDGEVRYPVRSWLTPSKVDQQLAVEIHEQAPATTIKVTVPLKSAEKKNRLEDDLQQKRERMIEKLKQDANQRRDKQSMTTAPQPGGMSAALSKTRKIAAMREKAKILPAKATMPPTIASTKLEASKAKLMGEVQEKRTMEVLTALQLSAKKQVSQQTDTDACKVRKPTAVPPMTSLDDNATTTLFTQTTTTTTYELTEKTERLPLKTLISKVKAEQRQCVQIEALPSLKGSRTTRLGRKKIVRKPLRFKGTNAPETIFEPDQLEEVKTPHKVNTESVAGKEDNGGKHVVVSPVPRIKIKTPTGLTADRRSTLRVSPRLLGNKKSKLKRANGDDKEDTLKDPIETTKTNKRLKSAKSKAANAARKFVATSNKKSPVRTRLTKSKNTAALDVLEAKKTVEEQKRDEDKVRDEKPNETIDMQTHVEHAMEEVDQVKSDRFDNIEKIEKPKPEKKKDTEKKEKEAKRLGNLTKGSKVRTEATKNDEEAAKIKQADMHAIAETKSEKSPLKETTASAQKRKSKDNIETVTDADDKQETNQKSEAASSSKIIDDTTISNKNTKTQEVTQDLQTQKDTINEGQKSNVDKLDVKIQDQAIEKYNLTKDSEAEGMAPKAELAQAINESKTLPTSTTNMETETETETAETSEEDPLERCELTSVTEEDPVRFVSVTYDGPDAAPANPLPRRDFTNFKMVVAFDEEEKHIWRISNEMVLFNASPASQQIRNIPKKRKVRINTCGTDNDNITTVGVVHSTTTTQQATTSTVSSSEERNQRDNILNEAKPIATSTPISAPATSSTQEPRRRITRTTGNAAAGTDVAGGSSCAASEATAQLATKSSTGPTDVLEIDDIESLLSRLHGKEN